MAARSLTLTSTAAPARPLGVALDHRGQDRVAGGDDVAAGDGRAVVADEAAPDPASPATSSPSGAFVAATRAAKRPIGQRIGTCGRPATTVSRTRSQPRRVNSDALPACTSASKRSTPAASARAQAARTSAAPTRVPARRRATGATTRRLPVHQPRSGRAGSGYGAEAHAAEDLARRRRGRPGRRRAGRRRARRGRRPGVGEQALLVDEHGAAQRPVGDDVGVAASPAGASPMVTARAPREVADPGRPPRISSAASISPRAPEHLPAVRVVGSPWGSSGGISAARRGERAARAAGRAAGGLVGAAHPGGRSTSATRAGDVGEQLGGRGRGRRRRRRACRGSGGRGRRRGRRRARSARRPRRRARRGPRRDRR